MNGILAVSLSAVFSFGITVLLGYGVVPWLRKLHFGQTILDEGPKWHKKKEGTPTMGGIMIVVGTFGAAALLLLLNSIMGNSMSITGDMYTKLWAGLIMALMFGMVGFADDYIKVIKKRNLGLSIGQKTIAQLAICASYLSSLYLAMGKDPYMFVPFIGNVRMSIWFWVLGFFAIYGTINAVNFTDGIDGLCSCVTSTVGASMLVIALMNKMFGVGILASALIGGSVGFFLWNKNPAKVFMGDTGSMFMGGIVVAVAYAIDCPLIILLTGIVYVIEALSDVIQIGYFKITHGKRIFKMAPIHHHFEMCGWSEKKIDAVFFLVNIAGGILGIIVMYFGGFVK